MFKLLRRIVANESAASFPFGAFLLPEAIIAANFPARKKKKSINRGWLAIFLDPQKTVSQTYREELSKDRKGERNRLGCLKMPVCSLTTPPSHSTPKKNERELPARAQIKEYFLRSHRDAE